ncbi:hypothetical protein B0H11DRAFT_1999964, partial [Mycena galericulata]
MGGIGKQIQEKKIVLNCVWPSLEPGKKKWLKPGPEPGSRVGQNLRPDPEPYLSPARPDPAHHYWPRWHFLHSSGRGSPLLLLWAIVNLVPLAHATRRHRSSLASTLSMAHSGVCSFVSSSQFVFYTIPEPPPSPSSLSHPFIWYSPSSSPMPEKKTLGP